MGRPRKVNHVARCAIAGEYKTRMMKATHAKTVDRAYDGTKMTAVRKYHEFISGKYLNHISTDRPSRPYSYDGASVHRTIVRLASCQNQYCKGEHVWPAKGSQSFENKYECQNCGEEFQLTLMDCLNPYIACEEKIEASNEHQELCIACAINEAVDLKIRASRYLSKAKRRGALGRPTRGVQEELLIEVAEWASIHYAVKILPSFVKDCLKEFPYNPM